MNKYLPTVSDLGEIALLEKFILPRVSQSSSAMGDDCAHVNLRQQSAIWSIDPCPTPVAYMLGLKDPKIMGWYTALINLSDIAACGGTPKGMLVSLEIPEDFLVQDIEIFYDGLMSALNKFNTPLLGGNVKASSKFSATGTILGEYGTRKITRHIDAESCQVYLIGNCGEFWASVVAHHEDIAALSPEVQAEFKKALAYPEAQIFAGYALSSLPFEVACMDCSDGPANAIAQLGNANNFEITVLDIPDWRISDHASHVLKKARINVENACYHFGDWQLAVLVPSNSVDIFLNKMSNFPITWVGHAKKGACLVKTESGRLLKSESLNENFRGGYNSIKNTTELLKRYLTQPVFI